MPINHRRRILRIAGLGLSLGAGMFSTQAAASCTSLRPPAVAAMAQNAGTSSIMRVSISPALIEAASAP